MMFSYLKSHSIPAACCLLAACIPAALSRLAGMSLDFCILCFLLSAMPLLAAGVFTFVREARFLRALECISQDTTGSPISYAAVELLEKPTFYEGRLSYDALHKVMLESQRQTTEAQAQMNQYRDYIETWVHEIKTPLAAARLMLQNEPTSNARELQVELSRTEELAEQALYLARSTSVEKDYVIRKTPLTSLVNTAIKSRAHTLIAVGIHVDTSDIVDKDLEVVCDSKWLVFILGQLIDNAVRYRTDHHKSDDEPPMLRFSAVIQKPCTAHERVDLHIWDNGCGIASEDIERVFDRGFTGQNGRTHTRSTGIGLYLVAELCHKMGLMVTISSQQYAWTDVCIGLPNLQK